jgi:hypothetical protein
MRDEALRLAIIRASAGFGEYANETDAECCFTTGGCAETRTCCAFLSQPQNTHSKGAKDKGRKVN